MKGNPSRLFVLNADVCCTFPLTEMLEIFEEKEAEAVLLGTRVGDDAARNFGCTFQPLLFDNQKYGGNSLTQIRHCV